MMKVHRLILYSYLDIKKAFDTLPHKWNLLKLKAYGSGDEIVCWNKDFRKGS